MSFAAMIEQTFDKTEKSQTRKTMTFKEDFGSEFVRTNKMK
jgi:hypothetical protein